MKEDIGKRISELRKSMNMNKEQFSKLIGISGQYLGTVEAGVNGLSLTSLINLCEKTNTRKLPSLYSGSITCVCQSSISIK